MLQLRYAEVDFGGQDLVSLLSWASDSDELDGLRVGSGWAPDGLRMGSGCSKKCLVILSCLRSGNVCLWFSHCKIGRGRDEGDQSGDQSKS